ncbi:hypothetical protein JTE90_005669 [Oedothorax gibbosus]|uniref:Uncharacterized protein n=1 Tax=Oedothorax gibbosus TaxID=931172 RepID=A0AAV6UGE8_9ARAC|nr:hypothetical protein JTE90_005669 [Oedothorax gibbosus]
MSITFLSNYHTRILSSLQKNEPNSCLCWCGRLLGVVRHRRSTGGGVRRIHAGDDGRDTLKNSEAIECYKDLGLDKFNWEEGEQPSEDEIEKKQEEFKSWLEEPEQKDKKGEIMECIMKVAKKTIEDLGDSVPENCKELAIKEIHANWHTEE